MFETTVTVIEEQKTYSWIRIFLKDDYKDMEEGDIISLFYLPNKEKIDLKFATYDKRNSIKKDEENIMDYNPEFDKKVLCILVDVKEIENNEDLKFIKTLFKDSKYYEHQLLKRSELIFKHKDEELDYHSVNF